MLCCGSVRKREEKMRDGEVEKLRAVVRDCLGKHLYSSAIFFADKLATLAGNATQDLYMQASGKDFILGQWPGFRFNRARQHFSEPFKFWCTSFNDQRT